MNSNYGKSNKSVFLNNLDFDFGLDTNRHRSLNEQRTGQAPNSFSSTQPKPIPSNTTPSWQPGKPSWTHQPAPNQPSWAGSGSRSESLNAPTSMVGDIFGKSWSSSSSTTSGSGVGVVNAKNPNLFGDLVSSAVGQNKGNANVPLKCSVPVSNKSPYSMHSVADSLRKSGGNDYFGSYTSGAYNNSSNVNANMNDKNSNLGGPSMQNAAAAGVATGAGIGMSSNKDPFANLGTFQSKPAASTNSASKGNNKSNLMENDAFGGFQNASSSGGYSFRQAAFQSNHSSSLGSRAAYSKLNDFGIPSSQNQPPIQSSGGNDFDVLFPSSSASGGNAVNVSLQFSGGDDWGLDSEVGGGNEVARTTELEELPPPPSGVSAAAAKNKGIDNKNQGQYADAIKWLSWAVILLQKTGDEASTMEVLACRASCYKEVGEYKKAVADCTKVLEQDDKNVSVLVQRALLYESMEKYKLGAEDLRTVMKIDPLNRVARSTIHRLTQMAG